MLYRSVIVPNRFERFRRSGASGEVFPNQLDSPLHLKVLKVVLVIDLPI